MTPALLLAALTVGYLAGRRSYRRKLQTSDGRARVGREPRRFSAVSVDLVAAEADLVSMDELLTPRTSEMPAVLLPTVQMSAVRPSTRPIPAPR